MSNDWVKKLAQQKAQAARHAADQARRDAETERRTLQVFDTQHRNLLGLLHVEIGKLVSAYKEEIPDSDISLQIHPQGDVSVERLTYPAVYLTVAANRGARNLQAEMTVAQSMDSRTSTARTLSVLVTAQNDLAFRDGTPEAVAASLMRPFFEAL